MFLNSQLFLHVHFNPMVQSWHQQKMICTFRSSHYTCMLHYFLKSFIISSQIMLLDLYWFRWYVYIWLVLESHIWNIHIFLLSRYSPNNHHSWVCECPNRFFSFTLSSWSCYINEWLRQSLELIFDGGGREIIEKSENIM